jgi:Bacterial regulatory proteins, tetR family
VNVSPRARILEIADQLFYSQGIRAVGVDTIVAQSGAAKTTLYAHFGASAGIEPRLDGRVVRSPICPSTSWLIRDGPR